MSAIPPLSGGKPTSGKPAATTASDRQRSLQTCGHAPDLTHRLGPLLSWIRAPLNGRGAGRNRLSAVLTAYVAEYSRRCRRSAYGRGKGEARDPIVANDA